MGRLLRKSENLESIKQEYLDYCKSLAADLRNDDISLVDQIAKDAIDEINSGRVHSELASLADKYYKSIEQTPIMENIIDDIVQY